MSRPVKKMTIIAGPNGAGKTTFVIDLFSDLFSKDKFINADHSAQEIYPEDVEGVAIKAGKHVLTEMDRLIHNSENFIVETTLSGKTLHKKIKAAKENGFQITLIFLWIRTLELCDFRVKARVASGGHNIPLVDVGRRYERGLMNFLGYAQNADRCEIYLADELPKLIYRKDIDGKEEPIHPDLYEEFL